MESYSGYPSFPVWLLADSEPENWRHLLRFPLDPRHPARHNIWTSILEYIQNYLYKRKRLMFDTGRLFIRNAVTDPAEKPKRTNVTWSDELQKQVSAFESSLRDYNPKVVLTFGAFAFEFARRACRDTPLYPYSHWSTEELGKEFKRRATAYVSQGINIIPLLHVSISRGKFFKSHKYFVGAEVKENPNYFEYVGNKLAEIFVQYFQHEPIWVK